MSATSRTSISRRTKGRPVDEADDIAEHRAELTDPVERRFYDRYIEKFDGWTTTDLDTLVLAAQNRSRLNTARAAIKKYGVLVRGQKNNWVRNPAVAIERACSVELRALLKQLTRLSEGDE